MTHEQAYEILGLDSNATQENAHAAYRDLAKIYHPDKNTAANASVMFRLIQDAWQCIQDTSEEESTKLPEDAEVYFDQENAMLDQANRGNTMLDQGEYDTAVVYYDNALALNPDSDIAHIVYSQRGIAKHFLGQYESAISDFDEALRLKPDFSASYTVYYRRGMSKSNLGEHFDAIMDFDETLRLKPDYASAYHGRGVAKSDFGQHVAAIADYDEAIRLENQIMR